MASGYELGTAETLEAVMERRTDDFDSLKTEELQTQWKHKISVIPESEGITTRWWSYTSGVSRAGPEAEVPAGETITTNKSGEYIVGTPALAGGAARVTGTAQSGAGDDWWNGYTDRINTPDADDNGMGIGYKYFADGEGDAGGATSAGAQEYVWFRSGVSGVSDKVVPRDQWNGDDLSEFSADLSKGNLFHRGGFVRIDHTFYNQGGGDVNFGIKTADGKLDVVTLHSFNVPNSPMWSQSDLKWQMGTAGTNLTGYINAAHYKGGNGKRTNRSNGTGRDGSVLGSSVSVSSGTPVPLISIRLRSGWENVNIRPGNVSVEMDGSYYVFISIGSSLDGATFEPPNSEFAEVNEPSSEYAVEVDNDATGFASLGTIEFFSYVEDGGQVGTSATDFNIEGFSLSNNDIATLAVIPVGATSFAGASLGWGMNF